MVQVVIVNGRPGCGKSSFERLAGEVSSQYSKTKVKILSSVDFIKEVATFCGWNGEKTPKNRKFLSDLKELLTEWDNVPFKKIKEEANHLAQDLYHDWILFVDCREPQEIKKLQEHLNAITVLVRREGDKNSETSNYSDEQVFNFDYDLIIENYGTIEDLKNKALCFIIYMNSEVGAKYKFKRGNK